MKNMGAMLVYAILANNFILAQFLGISPFIKGEKKLKPAVTLSLAVLVAMLLTTAITWPINSFLLGEQHQYLQILLFAVVVAVLLFLANVVLKKCVPALTTRLEKLLPLVFTNCAVLGVGFLSLAHGFSFGESMLYTLGGGLGFLLAMVLFVGVRQHMENAKPPKAFKGVPLTLVAASIVSLAFLAFRGM